MKCKNGLFTTAMLCTVTLVGCSSALSIKSTPSNATVTVKSMGLANEHELGSTPIASSLSELPENIANTDVLVLVVKKEGYIPKTVYLTETRSVDVEVDVNLDQDIKQDNSGEINELIDALFESQKAAQRGELKAAHKILDVLETKHKDVAAVYEMRGGLFILERQIPSALKAFNRALALNPKNNDIKKVVKALGSDDVRLPASSSPPEEVPIAKPDSPESEQPAKTEQQPAETGGP